MFENPTRVELDVCIWRLSNARKVITKSQKVTPNYLKTMETIQIRSTNVGFVLVVLVKNIMQLTHKYSAIRECSIFRPLLENA